MLHRFRRHPSDRKKSTIKAILSFVLFVMALASREAPGYAKDLGQAGTGGPSSTTHERCVDVTIGGSRSFDCLNLELKRQVGQATGSLPIAPFGATSPDISLGVVNVPAVKQQYGPNFGNSVFPYREPPLVFTSPLLPHR